jgi:DNA-directed RNA polymerase specialized sigma24 family protein
MHRPMPLPNHLPELLRVSPAKRVALANLTRLTPPTELAKPQPMTTGGDDDSAREALKRSILSDRTIHDSVRKVLRIKRVKPQEIDDLLQHILEDAYKSPSMPLEHEGARLWLGGAARHEAADYFTALKAKTESEAPARPGMVDPTSDAAEHRTLATTILEMLRARFGHKASWFERSEIHGETFKEIGATENLSPDHVRKEVSVMRRVAVVAASSFVLAAIAFLLAYHFTPGLAPEKQIAHPTKQRAPTWVEAPPVPSASFDVVTDPAVLRARARQEYELGQFDRVVSDLQSARALDPAGETAELKAMYDRAYAHLANSKPGN